ncbi:superoxide dismutase family protein [Litorivivens sp.]|uniref:superoxide dismutase family protein n=1 Tax=Litorivivens sp. TaxID=2020868 RepID=UPI00356912AB
MTGPFLRRTIFLAAFSLAAIPVFAINASKTEPPQATEKGKEITSANARLESTSGSSVSGIVTFRHDPEYDGLRVKVEVAGLKPGRHGIHIHERGDCSAADAQSAGGHFNPTNRRHGAPAHGKHHAGDLGNIAANAEGRVRTELKSDTITFNGETSILGKALILHAQPDDLASQPAGNAGKRVACGVIEPLLETDAG